MKKLIVKRNGELFEEVIVENDKVEETTAMFNESLISGDPDTYTLEVIDLDENYDFLLEQCYKKRLAAYPSIGDQLDAGYKARNGDASQLTAIDASIASVKSTFPKPIQS